MRELTEKLFEKFYPLEQDTSISLEEKLKHLDEWWTRDMSAFVSAGFNKTDFAHMTLTSKLLFRRSSLSLINLCREFKLPIVVLSGGIHELIEASFKILDQSQMDHVTIISNRFTYHDTPDLTYDHVHEGKDQLTKIVGFETPVVHPSSKQSVLYESKEKTELPRNLIVMGDIIADSQMSRDHEHDHQIKVGFFNKENGLEEFSKHFDIVITGDGTLCPVVYTISEMFG